MIQRLNYNILQRYAAIIAIALTVVAGGGVPTARAFSLSTYADHSALSTGRWVKVSVAETGIHMISAADLRSWGFSDPAKVRVHGYGGNRLPDLLNRSTFIDDLPLVQSVNTARGVYFYALGPTSWRVSAPQRYVQSHNPFSTVGYYYLTESDDPLPAIAEEGSTDVGDGDVAVSFYDRLYHEVDEYSPGLTGHYLVGEDFKYTPSRTFTFDLPDRNPMVGNVWLETAFMACTYGAPSRVTYTANGATVTSVGTDDIAATSNSSYYHGTEGISRREMSVSGERLTLKMTHSSSVTVHEARLNYLTVNYSRQLKMRDGKLLFWLDNPRMTIAGASAATHVWDVTNPLIITSVPMKATSGGMTGVNDYTGLRSYVAWNEDATFPSPKMVEEVANQDLHSEPVPNMVIFTATEWESQAERLAQFHRNSADSLKVLVVNQDKVFNEFSSGTPDINAFRKLLKMFWDRDVAASPVGEYNLRYALVMGRAFFDNRKLTTEGQTLGYPILPTWESDDGLCDNSSYTSDDILAFLTDGSGSAMPSDRYNIAVGRMPVRSLTDATNAVDKLMEYANSMTDGNWKNRVMMVADDEDKGEHMSQTEVMWRNMANSTLGDNYTFEKVYTDAYERIDNTYPQVRTRMFRLLDEGVWLWTYVGHASMTGWTHENILNSKDINSMYYKRYPILYAATCDFVKWDEAALSGAEIMWHTPGGGTIATIAATRPVYIQMNGYFTASMGNQLLQRDKLGRHLRIGDILKNVKNNIVDANGNSRPTDSNKLRFVLMGDPAMVMVAPSNLLKVTAINGKSVDPDNPPTIMARQEAVIEGEVTDGLGNTLRDFSGSLYVTIYDAERSVTTKRNGSNPPPSAFVYDEQGSRLYSGIDSVRNGQFKVKVPMPIEIADNYRPAAINLYARAADRREAIGCHRDVYVYGLDENATPDTQAPTIDLFALNQEGFKTGGAVNSSPVVLARVSDNRGINLSQAGIGHQMTLTLDGTRTYTDVAECYTPASDGSVGGSIVYPLEDLSDGPHTLQLRVWDTSSNIAERTIDFVVQQGLAPSILNVYTDANPASVEANFYVTHDRPDAMVTVTVSVYNLLGAELWSSTATGRSDMFQSVPVKWDLRDKAGHRVGRGIYLYRATITADGEEHTSASRKIAVTGN